MMKDLIGFGQANPPHPCILGISPPVSYKRCFSKIRKQLFLFWLEKSTCVLDAAPLISANLFNLPWRPNSELLCFYTSISCKSIYLCFVEVFSPLYLSTCLGESFLTLFTKNTTFTSEVPWKVSKNSFQNQSFPWILSMYIFLNLLLILLIVLGQS